VPEYFGDMAVVNGVIWPKKTVEARPYRLRLLGGSNARCWVLNLSAVAPVGTKLKTPAPSFTVVATEQGYVPAPIVTPTLDICPGERYEVIVDFTGLPAGTQIFVNNTGAAPYPAGITPQANKSPYAAMAQVLRFDVTTTVATVPGSTTPPPALPLTPWVAPATFTASTYNTRPALNPVPATALTREMVLNEVLDPLGFPLRVQIDGKPFEAPVTETPKRGTVEIWKIINTTVDAHPIHLHLVQFKVLNRQAFNTRKYATAVGLAGLAAGGVLTPTPIAPYLSGKARGPDPFEVGWKDTVRALPGEVTTIAAYWDAGWDDCDPVNPAKTPNCKLTPAVQTAPAGYAGPTYLTAAGTTAICEPDPLNPAVCAVDAALAPIPVYRPHFEAVTSGPYVWHCHIVDHEDNEMMRPSLVIP
jgi:FtsP/CotA-like multicopper oxidase with cupredoxin domain